MVGRLLPELTVREEECALLAAEGMTSNDIAHKLVIQLGTVKTHLAEAYRKLDVHSRAKLATLVARRRTMAQTDRIVLFEATPWRWRIPNEEHVERFYVDSEKEYHIRLASPGKYTRVLVRRDFRDFELEVNLRKVSGDDYAAYGLTFVIVKDGGDEERHIILLSGLGTYRYTVIDHRGDGKERVVTRPKVETQSEYILGGDSSNHLRLIRLGSTLRFEVNQHTLFSIPAPIPEDQQVTVGIHIRAQDEEGNDYLIEIAFSELRVLAPQ